MLLLFGRKKKCAVIRHSIHFQKERERAAVSQQRIINRHEYQIGSFLCACYHFYVLQLRKTNNFFLSRYSLRKIRACADVQVLGSPNTLFTVYWLTRANILPLVIWAKNQIPQHIETKLKRIWKLFFFHTKKIIQSKEEERKEVEEKNVSPAKFHHSEMKTVHFSKCEISISWETVESNEKASVWLWSWMFESGLALKKNN